MTPLRLLLTVAMALASVGTGTALADTKDPYCTFTLTPPTHTQIGSGADVVTATLSPQHCNGTAWPTRSTVCASAAGISQNCQTALGWNASPVFLAPWRAGVAYTVSGNGCYLKGNPATPVCAPSGPLTVTL